MTMLNIVFVALAVSVADAAVVSNLRSTQQIPVQAMIQAHQVPAAAGAFDWTSLGIGLGIGAAVGGLIGLAAMKAMGGSAPKDGEETSEKEGKEAEPAPAAAVEEEEVEEVDDSNASNYQELLKVLAQKVAQEVGPKLSKGGAVKNVLDSRMKSFTDNAKAFMMNEVNGTAGAVLRELDAPEAMMLLDLDSAVEANFPPAAILVAGVLSPTVIKLMSIHHLIQMVSVGLPIMILCAIAIYIDWSAPCSIPTIFTWLFTQTALAACLVIGHGALLFQTWLGKRTLAQKAQELHDNANADDQVGNMRDEFVGNTIILQEALVIENAIRKSFWNNVVGLATFAWIITTIWNLVLICGWTFVPGVTAFHPKAAEVAKGDYCGAWMTVLVLRINMLLAVLFLFLNLATVVKWICDISIESQGFQQSVLKTARTMDKNGSGLPVVELLVKAFLLRGGSDTLNSKLAVVQSQKSELEKKKALVESQLNSVTSEIGYVEAEESSLKSQAADKGDALQAQVNKLVGNEVDAWKSTGDKAIAEAEERANKVREETTKAIELLWEKIQKVIEAMQKSDYAKLLEAKLEECQSKFTEAMDTLQDENFQQQLKDAALKAAGDAQAMATQAIEAATDPEKQKELQEAMQKAMEQAQNAADAVVAAANDPEKRRQLQEAANKAMEDAKKAASEAAEGLTDPAMQEKMKKAAKEACDQAQLAAQSAVAALQDPNLAKKLEDAAQQAMEEAQALQRKAKSVAYDPELMAKATKAMEEAQAAAEKAKAAMIDPETQKMLTQAAKDFQAQAAEAAEVAKAQAAEAAQQAAAEVAKAKEAAAAAAEPKSE